MCATIFIVEISASLKLFPNKKLNSIDPLATQKLLMTSLWSFLKVWKDGNQIEVVLFV